MVGVRWTLVGLLMKPRYSVAMMAMVNDRSSCLDRQNFDDVWEPKCFNPKHHQTTTFFMMFLMMFDFRVLMLTHPCAKYPCDLGSPRGASSSLLCDREITGIKTWPRHDTKIRHQDGQNPIFDHPWPLKMEKYIQWHSNISKRYRSMYFSNIQKNKRSCQQFYGSTQREKNTKENGENREHIISRGIGSQELEMHMAS